MTLDCKDWKLGLQLKRKRKSSLQAVFFFFFRSFLSPAQLSLKVSRGSVCFDFYPTTGEDCRAKEKFDLRVIGAVWDIIKENTGSLLFFTQAGREKKIYGKRILTTKETKTSQTNKFSAGKLARCYGNPTGFLCSLPAGVTILSPYLSPPPLLQRCSCPTLQHSWVFLGSHYITTVSTWII